MSIKGDLIAVGVAGVVLLAAGWYAKKKLDGAVTGAVNGAGNAVRSVFNNVTDVVAGAGQVFAPAVGSPVKDAINAPARFVDGYINSAGQYITGNVNWNQASWLYRLPDDFGIVNPNEGW